MISCPHCGADNWPDQTTCYACGGDLRAGSKPGALGASTIPTQPVRVRQGSSTAAATSHLQAPLQTRPQEQQPAYRPSENVTHPSRWQEQPAVAPPAPANVTVRDRLDSARRWRILAVFLGLIVICAGLFAVWVIGATAVNSLSRAAAQVQTRIPQNLPELPGAPEATATEAPFIPSPWPTPTGPGSLLTPVVGSTPSPDWQRYLTPECSAALDHLRTANQYLSDNPGAPLEQSWRDDLSAAVGEMRAYCGTLDTASPVPDLIRSAHENFTRATDEFDGANQLFKESLDEFNPGKALDAIARYRVAVKYLTAALDELNKIGN